MKDLTAKLIAVSPIILTGAAGLMAATASAVIGYEAREQAYQLMSYVSSIATGAFGATCLAAAGRVVGSN